MLPVFKNILFIIILICEIAVFSQAGDIHLSNDSSFENSKIIKLFNSYNRSVDSLVSYFIDEGYLDAEIGFKNDTLFVKTGDLFYLRKIVLENDTIAIETEIPFVKNKFMTEISRILSQYYDKEFIYPRIEIIKVIGQSHYLDVELSLNEGPVLIVDKVKYLNLNRTDPDIIARYLRVSPGDTLSRSKIGLLSDEASNIPFVSFKPPLEVKPNPGYQSADLIFNFKERKQVLFEGFAGVVSGESALSWNAKLKLQNMFGRGRNLSLISDHRIKNRQVLQIDYTQPFFKFGKGEIGLELFTRDYRDQFYEFSIIGKMETESGNKLSLGFQPGYRSVEPSRDYPSYEVYQSGVLLSKSRLDNQFNPSSGWQTSWKLDYSHRRYTGDSSLSMNQGKYNETRIDIEMTYYMKLYRKFILGLSGRYLGFETKEDIIPSSELYFIGGAATLRGFRTEQFEAIRAFLFTVEPRFKFTDGNLFVFFDGAYLGNRIIKDSTVNKITDYYYGYGMGLAVIDEVRLIKISVGWNKELPLDNPYISILFSYRI